MTNGLARAPELSVVIGANGAARGVGECLAALTRACAGIETEIILVDASGEASRAEVKRDFPSVTFVAAPADTLIPCLWASGFRCSRGRIVAFSIANCTVPEGWGRAIRDGLARGNYGVGGALRLAPAASATDWSIFHLRYSAFLGDGATPVRVADIPGDNAAYLRDALDAHAHTFEDGFWEFDFHRRMRPTGGQLELLPAMQATYGRSGPLMKLVAQRYRHGRQSGQGRVESGVRRPWQIVLAAPAVPALLLLRTARALKRSGGPVRVGALPSFLLIAAAWAAGEAAGALRRQPACPG